MILFLMWTLFRKEIVGFFSNLTGHLVIVVFLLSNSAFIWLFNNPLNIIAGGYGEDTLWGGDGDDLLWGGHARHGALADDDTIA